MPISSTLRGSFPTVGSSECCKIRLHLRPWASSLFWSSETQIANAWFPCLRQKQGEIPERSCCFKCWPLTSEVCRFCSLSWRLSPQGVAARTSEQQDGGSLRRACYPLGSSGPRYLPDFSCHRWSFACDESLWKGLLCIWVWRNIYQIYIVAIFFIECIICIGIYVFARVSNVWTDDKHLVMFDRTFWSDGRIFCGCKVIGGLLGRMLAPRPEGEAEWLETKTATPVHVYVFFYMIL